MNKQDIIRRIETEVHDISDTPKLYDYIQVDVSDLKSGIIKEMGTSKFCVLMTIVALKELKKMPLHQDVMRYTGLSRPTVSKEFKELKEMGYLDALYVKKVTPRDIINYYLEYYENEFNHKPNIMWARDTKFVKDRLMKRFDYDTIENIIRVGISLYEEKYKNLDYPHVSINVLSGWFLEKVLAQIDKLGSVEEVSYEDAVDEIDDRL